MHCGPWLELFGFCCPPLGKRNYNSTTYLYRKKKVLHLLPPLVAVDVAYPHYSACLSVQKTAVTRDFIIGLEGKTKTLQVHHTF